VPFAVLYVLDICSLGGFRIPGLFPIPSFPLPAHSYIYADAWWLALLGTLADAVPMFTFAA